MNQRIDGATPLQIFIKLLTFQSINDYCFLVAFVWYWNETLLQPFVRSTPTIPLRIQQFKASYEAMFPPGTPGSELNEAIKLAGHLIGILPLLILYFVMQKHFTESIDRTGIAGE